MRQPVYLYETRVVATPLAGRLRLAGTLELGSDPDAVGRRRVDAVVAAGRAPHRRRGGRQALARLARPAAHGLRRHADHRPTAPSDRVIVATGHGVLGITLAPSTAELVATLARRQRARSVARALRPGRFRRLAGISVLAPPHQAADRGHHLVRPLLARPRVAAPTTQCFAWSSSRPSATLSSAAWIAEIWVRMSMQ